MNSDKTAAPQGNEPDGKQAKERLILEILKRLSGGESLSSIMVATGLSDIEMRSCFQQAYYLVSQNSGDGGDAATIVDWKTMSIADALAMLAAHGGSGINSK